MVMVPPLLLVMTIPSSLDGEFVNALSVTGIPNALQIGSLGATGVDVGVAVIVGVEEGVNVRVTVEVGARVRVAVFTGVRVRVGVAVHRGVQEGSTKPVLDGGMVGDGVRVGVSVNIDVGVEVIWLCNCC